MDATTHTQDLTNLDPAALERPSCSALGRFGEDLAAQHLVDGHGMTLVARNWRIALDELRGELDVVAVDDAAGVLVICEVKTRRSAARFGGAAAAISFDKRAQLRRLSTVFLRESSLFYPRVRLDVIAIDLRPRPRLTHLEGSL